LELFRFWDAFQIEAVNLDLPRIALPIPGIGDET